MSSIQDVEECDATNAKLKNKRAVYKNYRNYFIKFLLPMLTAEPVAINAEAGCCVR